MAEEAVRRSWYPRLATLPEALSIAAGSSPLLHSWPPAGTETQTLAFPEPWVLVRELEPGSADSAHGYWTTVDDILAPFPTIVTRALLWISRSLAGRWVGVVSAVGHWPVVWEANQGAFMQWIQTSIRGVLGGGVEQFQWKMDWGVPGDDPDLAENDAPAYAEALAGVISGEWAATQTDGELRSQYPTNLKLTEVGAVQVSSVDGKRKQAYPTAWFGYPTASQPAGTSAGNSLPYEVACAVSLRTDTRGPRGRGRLYLPAPSVGAMWPNGIWNNSFAKPAGEFVHAVAEAQKSASGHDLIVVSLAATQLHKVTLVQVGQVPDSQRSRRRSQIEAPYDLGTL